MTRPLIQSPIRLTALVLVAAGLLSPLVFLGATNAFESVRTARMLRRTEDTCAALAELVAQSGGDIDAVRRTADPLLRTNAQRGRVIEPEGAVLSLGDYVAADTLFSHLGRAGAARLDDGSGSLADRPEVLEAWSTGRPGVRCTDLPVGSLRVCAVAQAVSTPAGTYLVHVQGRSPRALEALADSRTQLLELTAVGGIIGLLLALWMGRRLVRPLEKLQLEVMRRAAAALPRADLHADPDDEVGDLARAFNSLLAALQDRRRANEGFLADLAHELKNPIASVRAAAERLRESEPPDAERSLLLGQVLGRSAAALDRLVTQFLELARAEAGLPSETQVPVDLGELLAGLIRAMQDDPRHGGVALTLRAPEAPVRIQGAVGRIESALRNVLDNAVHFARLGAGESPTVEVALAQAGSEAEVTVADNGPGIAPGDLPRLFERFFTTRGPLQGDGPGEARGTGLGLALTRAIVEAHGGTIRAESTPGQGTRLSIRLPFTHDSQV